MKRKFCIAFTVVFVLTMMLAGCGKSNFGVRVNEDLNIEIIAENATADMSGAVGTFTVEKGDKVVIEPSFEKGSVLVQFYTFDAPSPDIEVTENEAESADDIGAELNVEDVVGQGDPVFEVEVSGTEPIECSFGEGDFMVSATAQNKVTGTAVIYAVNTEEQSMWTKADSAEAAAAGAGLDGFNVPPVGTAIGGGEITNEAYGYMEGAAEANLPFGAVDLFIHKGLTSTVGEDVSFDSNEYAYEWTEHVDGFEVQCFGNRGGAATKTIWTSGDYSYAILAYGAGGDTDYGLSVDDLSTLINNIE